MSPMKYRRRSVNLSFRDTAFIANLGGPGGGGGGGGGGPIVCLGDYTPGQISNPFVGNVTITLQADVDALAGYDGITGNLTISDTNSITDGSPLNGLAEISGTVTFNAGTDPDRIPLTGLGYVGGGVTLLMSSTTVTTLDGVMPNLRRVNGTVWLRYGPNLAALGTFMQHLHHVGWLRFQLEESNVSLDGAFPCLVSATDISIDSQSSRLFNGTTTYDLTNAFSSLTTNSSLSLKPNRNHPIEITSYSGAFPALVNTSYIEFRSTQLTTNFSTPFAALQTVGDIYLYAYGGAEPIPAFPSLTTVSNYFAVEVGDGAVFTAPMPTYSALTSVYYITLGTSFLTAGATGTWNGLFPNVTTLTHGFYMYADGVTAMENCLPLVTTTGNAGVSINPSVATLASIDGSFASLASTEYLNIRFTALTDLDNFSALTSLLFGGAFTGAIDIRNNPNLTSVSGLLNVVGSTVSSLTIRDNPSLPTTAQAAALNANYVGEGFVGVFTNINNGPG